MARSTLHEDLYRDLDPARARVVVVLGLGAIGGALAELLARMGYARLTLVDKDRVEEHNLSTQPYTLLEVGKPKAVALSGSLYRAVGARCSGTHGTFTLRTGARMIGDAAVLVDCFDNRESRVAAQSVGDAVDVPVLHLALGLSGRYGQGLWNHAYVPPPIDHAGIDGCDYPLTRPLAQVVAAAGAEVLTRALLGQGMQGFEFTLGDLRLGLTGGPS